MAYSCSLSHCSVSNCLARIAMEDCRLFNIMIALVVLLSLLILPADLQAQPVDIEEQARVIAAELRCPVCQNLSVADSPSEVARQMDAIIVQQLKEGKSPEQVRAYFVSKYGEWILLSPTPRGFSLLLWVLPYTALAGGILFVIFFVRRRVRSRPKGRPSEADPDLIQRVRRELATETAWEVGPDVKGPQAPLIRERARLYAELRDLEFDFQAGRFSKSDYQEMRQGYEAQATAILKDLDALPPATPPPTAARVAPEDGQIPSSAKVGSRRAWIFAATAIFLLIFGVTLGIFLGKSLRPRTSLEDSITGDFLTGTGIENRPSPPGIEGKDIGALLNQGRASFERKEWPQAIEAFKKVLSMEANHPEAHAYMGLILSGAGHADSALLAFNRALTSDPNHALALWGSGMVLYRQKDDANGARQNFKKLLTLLPPGAEKEQIRKTLREMGKGEREGEIKQTKTADHRIQGVISIDPKLRSQFQGQGVLFIIARLAASQGGPPLAVKKIDRPAFPLSYYLGQDNTMIPGTPFSGRLIITARLDMDGNAVTREPGNLTGNYKNNPAEVGSQNVDIILNQEIQ